MSTLRHTPKPANHLQKSCWVGTSGRPYRPFNGTRAKQDACCRLHNVGSCRVILCTRETSGPAPSGFLVVCCDVWATSCTSCGLQTVLCTDATGTTCAEHGTMSPEAMKRRPLLRSRIHQAPPWDLSGLRRRSLSGVPLANAAQCDVTASMTKGEGM